MMAARDRPAPGASTRMTVGLFLGAWAIATLYLVQHGTDWMRPVATLLVYGALLPALAVWMTRATDAAPVPVDDPPRESIAMLLYMLLFYPIFVLGWLFSQVNDVFSPGQAHEVVMLVVKLIMHVALPTLLILALGGHVRALWSVGLGRKGVFTTLLVFSALLFALSALSTPALERIASTGLAPAQALPWVLGAWLWASVQGGLCEEYLFRAVLQSRLNAWLGSPVTAIGLTALIFALAHVPGIYWRGTPDTSGWSSNLLEVMAYAIAMLAPLGILFGVLWLRTRSLLLIVLVHSALDALPHTASFFDLWR